MLKLKTIWTERKRIGEERLSICKECDSFVERTTKCQECGCFMQAKTLWPDATCPLGKWGTFEDNKDLPH